MAEVIVEGAPVFVKFFSSLDPSSDQYNEIDEILDLLKNNPGYGDKIRRNLWPELYVKKYGIHTLFRTRLSKGRRMMYTISGTRDSKMVTILEVLDHGEYENRFGTEAPLAQPFGNSVQSFQLWVVCENPCDGTFLVYHDFVRFFQILQYFSECRILDLSWQRPPELVP